MSLPHFPKVVPLSLALALLPTLPACKQTSFKMPAMPKLSFLKKGGAPAAPGNETNPKPAAPPSDRSPEETAFLDKCKTLGAAGGTIAGQDGWNFAASELQRLAQLQDPAASAVREATSAITDYRDSLKRKGIDLILVPVPPKAILFPDKLDKDLKIKSKSKKPARLDSTLQAIYASLRAKNVNVIDPTEALLSSRLNRKAGPIFPKTSPSWAPRGAEVAASLIASSLKGAKWANQPGKDGPLITEAATITYTGSLIAGTSKAETLSLRNIGRAADGKMRSVTFSTGGHPLTLIGDPSLLAWREANNPTGSTGTFASLADQLAFELQTTPDLFPGKSEGRNASRLRILRDGSNGRNPLSDTKTLVWIIQATDFASSDWQNIPLTLTTRSTSTSSSVPMFQAPPVNLIPDRSGPPVSPPNTPTPPAPSAAPAGEPALPELPR